MRHAFTLTLSLLLGAGWLAAQSPDFDRIRLDRLYTGELTGVLDHVARDTGVPISYDGDQIAGVEVVERAFNAPLDEFLNKILSPEGLTWTLTEDGIRVLTQAEALRGEMFPYLPPKAYDGPPTRFELTVSGRVNDAETGEPLPFVSILVAGTGRGGTSNADGFFALVDVPSDTATLVFSYLGYAPRRVRLNPEIGVEELAVGLSVIGNVLGEIVVVEQRQDLMQAGQEVSLLKMTPAKLAALPNMGERDIFRSFQLMPGISAANEHTSGLYVRGGTPDQALTLFDGFTVYNVDHLFGFFSAFNANAIKDVQLYKGTFDAEFGGRLSSVVEITGKEGNAKRLNAGADVSLLSLNGFVEGPLTKNVTGVLTARRSWRSSLYNEIFERFSGEQSSALNERFGSTVASYFYDLNGKLTWRPTSRDVVSLSFYNGQDDLDNSINPELPGFLDPEDFNIGITDLTNWGNTGSSLRWGRQWNDRLYGSTLISYSTYFSDRDRSLENTFTDADGERQTIRRGTFEDSDLLDYTAKSDWKWKASGSHEVGFGAFYTRNDIGYTYAQNDTSTVLDRQTAGATLGIYLQDEIRLGGDRLRLNPGLRTTYFEPTGQLYHEPRLSAMYALTDRLTLKGAVGRYYQFAKRVIREDILEGSRDFWVLADDDRLPVSSNDQIVLGASYETKDWLFDVEAYAKNLDGLSEYSLRIAPFGGAIGADERFLIGTGTARGIDFLIQKKYGRWNGWLSYSLGDVRNNFPEFGENDFYALNDVTHELKLVQTLKLGRFDLSATWIYASGRPFTAPEGGYQVDFLDGTTGDFLTVGSKNGLRLSSYHRLDVSGTMRLGQKSNSLSLSLFNLYGRQNVWYKTFEVVEDTVVPVDVNYLGFTPNLTFSWRLR